MAVRESVHRSRGERMESNIEIPFSEEGLNQEAAVECLQGLVFLAATFFPGIDGLSAMETASAIGGPVRSVHVAAAVVAIDVRFVHGWLLSLKPSCQTGSDIGCPTYKFFKLFF